MTFVSYKALTFDLHMYDDISVILFCPLVPVQIDVFNFLFIKKRVIIIIGGIFIFGLEMDILDIVKIWIYGFNWIILTNFSILY